jgi:nucleotide-binding universal stress UspA family protein
MHRTYQLVVGVDGSPGGRRALRWALREAAHRSGTVQAVCAWRPGNDGGTDSAEHATELCRGRADRRSGSHGNGRAYHAALGSVSEESVRYAFCPVVVVPVPHPEREQLREEPAVAGG